MTVDWAAVGVLVTIVSIALVEIAQQKKTSEAWGELSATLKNLKEYFEKEQANNKENYKEVCGRLDEHDDMLNDHELQIALLKNKGEIK